MARSSRDSDDSTDSEEELDSPKRITQQPAAQGETMDVDSTEGRGLIGYLEMYGLTSFKVENILMNLFYHLTSLRDKVIAYQLI